MPGCCEPDFGVEVVSAFSVLDHLSHSQIQSFLICPRKWHYEKVEHAPKEQVSSNLIFGVAVHDALAAVNETALTGDKIDAVGAFIGAWKATIEEVSAPVHFGKDDADSLIEKGKALVAMYQAPNGIIGVEQPFTVEVDPDLPPVEGRIDLIRRDDDGNLTISDLKTSGTKILSDTYAAESQLGLYNLAYPAAKHEVIVLGKLKSPTITVQPIQAWNHDLIRQQYREVHDAMKYGIRYAHRGWPCEGCSFYNRCQKDCS